MSDLTDFLLQRIAEDEAEARRAAQEFEGVGVGTPPTWGRRQWEFRVDRRNPALVDYLVKHSPERVLAECEAKRRIVERCSRILAIEVWEYYDTPDLAEAILCDLALPHADHPDYREEWRA